MGYFNPHSREGSDLLINDRIPYTDISIHTPAKGVTTSRSQIISGFPISIHTPAKGVTIMGTDYFKVPPDFNPHSREGSDDAII